jgi:hypothetical protein
MISWHKHSDICDVWLCEGVVYHTPGEIYSLMTTYDSPFSPNKIPLFHFRNVIDTICAHLTPYNTWILHAGRAARRCCIQDEQQEVLAQVLW